MAMLLKGAPVASALNEKMKGLGLKTRIKYEMEKGYRLVN